MMPRAAVQQHLAEDPYLSVAFPLLTKDLLNLSQVQSKF